MRTEPSNLNTSYTKNRWYARFTYKNEEFVNQRNQAIDATGASTEGTRVQVNQRTGQVQ
jgi:SPX domain protein involved in polyphosphate accumulation